MDSASARYRQAVVINPPNPTGYVSNKDSMGGFGQLYPTGAPPFPPLDVPYLIAYLAEQQLPAVVLEAGALNWTTADVIARLRETGSLAETLVLVRTSLPTIDWDLKFCADVKTAVAPAGLGLFGPVIPSLARRIEQDASIDFAVLGEPDVTVSELMKGTPIDQVPGLMYRSADSWLRTADRPLERDLDSLPFPKWEVMPVDR